MLSASVPIDSDAKAFKYLFWLFFAVLAFLVFTIVGDYGISWDEWPQNEYGKKVIAYYLSGFSDKSALNFGDLYLYGGLFDSVAAALNTISPYGEYETRHILNAFVGLLGVIGVWRLSAALLGYRAGFIAALIVVLIPSYFGHSFNNPKDIPFAVGYIWSLYYIIRIIDELPHISRSLALKLGICIGLTLAVRVGGLLLIAYLGLVICIAIALQLKIKPWHESRRIIGKLLLSALGISVLAYVIMILCWPWALESPLIRPWMALQQITHFKWSGSVLFDGEYISASELPNSYLPVYLWVKLPIFVPVVLFAAAIFVLPRPITWRLGPGGARLPVKVTLVIFSVIFPLVYIMLRDSVVYDGIRHVMFIVPSLAVLAAVSYEKILSTLESLKRLRWGFVLLSFVYLGFHLISLIELHPYQYVYYSEAAGGLRGAHNRFETDYWATSYREAAQILNRHVDSLPDRSRIYFIEVCGPNLNAAYYFSPQLKLVDTDGQADYFISFTRMKCHTRYGDKPLIGVVQRDGIPLTLVKQL
jgi:hypothetical protein